jgi:hypothetical protein
MQAEDVRVEALLREQDGMSRPMAQLIVDGIDRFSEGEVGLAIDAMSRALRLQPGHERTASYIDWLRAVQGGASDWMPPWAGLLRSADAPSASMRAITITAVNLVPLDVPELTDGQILKLAGDNMLDSVDEPELTIEKSLEIEAEPEESLTAVEAEDLARGISEAMAVGDFDASVSLAEELLGRAGGIHAPLAVQHRETLERLYEELLGPPDGVLLPVGTRAVLEPRSAFMLSRVDGMTTTEDLLDLSGMSRIETLRLLSQLLRGGSLRRS